MYCHYSYFRLEHQANKLWIPSHSTFNSHKVKMFRLNLDLLFNGYEFPGMDRSKFPYKGPDPDDDCQGRQHPHSGVTTENVSPSPGCPEHQCRGQNIHDHLHQVYNGDQLKMAII